MKQAYFSGWDNPHAIEVIESHGVKKVLIRGRPYLSWQSEDVSSQRMAIVQLYESKLATREKLALLFGIHENVVGRYITNFARDGLEGLISQQSGPKESWKLKPRVRGKILLIALKQGILKYESIQKRLEEWGESISVPSIRQVLLENGLIKDRVNNFEDSNGQREFFNNDKRGRQLYLPAFGQYCFTINIFILFSLEGAIK
ncbi:MAG: hypothetical protein DDT40_00277 [candidate division WS2 bacterium]|nr:hypothetical protein [Candidatus Psychracetigena formicireducens]